MIRQLRREVLSAQFGRYMLVGFWNTLFGYATFAGLTYALTDHLPYAYMLAALLSWIVNITVSYVGYKVLVFKTKGNYLREYLRCYVVYGTAAAASIVLLPVLVIALRTVLAEKAYAPYIAGGILTGVSVVCSFIGHKRFSFSP